MKSFFSRKAALGALTLALLASYSAHAMQMPSNWAKGARALGQVTFGVAAAAALYYGYKEIKNIIAGNPAIAGSPLQYDLYAHPHQSPITHTNTRQEQSIDVVKTYTHAADAVNQITVYNCEPGSCEFKPVDRADIKITATTIGNEFVQNPHVQIIQHLEGNILKITTVPDERDGGSVDYVIEVPQDKEIVTVAFERLR
jgi:hypothetical protein